MSLEWFYVIGVAIGAYLNIGMLFADFEHDFNDPEILKQTSDTQRSRENLGISIVIGGLISVIWPIGLPGIFCLTGFNPYDIWKTYKIKRCWQAEPPTKFSDGR